MGKNGIKTVKYHNEEKNITAKHSNIDDIALKRIRKYCGKKKKKKNTKHFLKVKNVFEKLFEQLTRDITECCKLPKTKELRKKIRI